MVCGEVHSPISRALRAELSSRPPIQYPTTRYKVHTIPYLAAVHEQHCQRPLSLRTELLGNLGALFITATRATTSSKGAQRQQYSAALCKCRQSSLAQGPCGGTAAPKPCSQTTGVQNKNKRKRDILRRTAMHASHRRELLVPRERRRPVESQRASSYTPREFMAVQKRRFFVLRMPSRRHP